MADAEGSPLQQVGLFSLISVRNDYEILAESLFLMKSRKRLFIVLRFKDKIQNLTWPEVYSLYEEGHQNALAIIDLVLTLPASSAVNEREHHRWLLLK